VFNQLFTFRNIIINASSAEETLLASIQNTVVVNERLRQAGLSSALKAAETREREQERIRAVEAAASHIHLNQLMATSLQAEKSETMAREQRKDPYTACSIRRGLFHEGAIGYAVHPESGVESIPPLFEVLIENLSLLRIDGASPPRESVMKIVSFSAAPPISQFHPNFKSNPCLLAPIAISNLASVTSGIHGAGFLRSHSLFVSTIQRLAIMARPERLTSFIQRALDIYYFEIRLWFSNLGRSHFIPNGWSMKRYIESVSPQLGNPSEFDDKDILNELRRDLSLADKRPLVPDAVEPGRPIKLSILNDPSSKSTSILHGRTSSDKPKGFYAFKLDLLPVDDTGIKICAFFGSGRLCSRSPCPFSHKFVMSDAQMTACRKPERT
jgi:hypothetical protein